MALYESLKYNSLKKSKYKFLTESKIAIFLSLSLLSHLSSFLVSLLILMIHIYYIISVRNISYSGSNVFIIIIRVFEVTLKILILIILLDAFFIFPQLFVYNKHFTENTIIKFWDRDVGYVIKSILMNTLNPLVIIIYFFVYCMEKRKISRRKKH